MEHNYSTVQLNEWRDYKLFVERFSGNWAFRGQADAGWVLNNAIERTAFIRFRKRIEEDFVSEFQRGARNYLSKDETPEHLIEWLALMQHHGAPTRLLDLTRSPYIAAYFAFEFSLANDGQNIAVWAVNIQHLRDRALSILSEEFGDALKQSRNLINEDLFEKAYYSHVVKLRKPHADIFSLVLKENNLAPSETLFIDDTESNFPEAQKLGIQIYHLKHGMSITDMDIFKNQTEKN